jgi:NADH dehydrogenase FAD-containing subunit
MAEKRIVIAGGGVAGKSLAAELLKKKVSAKIIVIEPKEYFEVPFAQLRGLVEPQDFGMTIRRPLEDLLPGADIIHECATGLAKNAVQLQSGGSVTYDLLVLATGSRFSRWPFLKGNELTIADRERKMQTEGEKLAKANSVLIIGGGPVGVELTGEIASKWPEKKITLIQGGERLLNALSTRMSDRANQVLDNMGVIIITGKKLSQDTDGIWMDIQGDAYTAHVIIPAVGIEINTEWIPEDNNIPKTEIGAVKVEPDLRIQGHNRIFAIGDINDVPEIKLGGFARMQAQLTAKNILNLLRNSQATLKGYKPHRPMGAVTLGRKHGAVQLPVGHPHFLIFMKQRDLFTGMYLKKA